MHSFLEKNLADIRQLCAQHKVAKLYVFGSLTNATFDEKHSDADFIVAFESLSRQAFAQHYLDLMVSLSALLQRPVDLLLDEPSGNPYFEAELLETKQLIYEQTSEEVFV